MMKKIILILTLLTLSVSSYAENPTPRDCPQGTSPATCRSQCDAADGTWASSGNSSGPVGTCTAVWSNSNGGGAYGSIKKKVDKK